ncbi:uncharacterized protein LOC143462878 isoform X1 [Clavelina lepadiformis]|uniref:uncharacterized protein LOC143462878 isoform X1 n=2 Tax=Clavelina lepadiformis TaxID=159417 RepID=UPI0040436900
MRMTTDVFILSIIIMSVSFEIAQIEGCHLPHLGIKRKKRAAEDIAAVRTFFSDCLQQNARTLRWAGPVDFVVVHSQWFSQTISLCSGSSQTILTECWIEQANDLLSPSMPLLDQLKDCIIDYTLNTTGMQYQGSRFLSNRTQRGEDSEGCPVIQPEEFNAMFLAEFTGNLTDETDESIDFISDVIDVMQNEMICTSCTCRELSSSVGTLLEYDYEDEAIECDDCWATKFASMAISNSLLARPLGRSSIMTNHLRTVTDPICGNTTYLPGFATDIDDRLNLRVSCLSDRIEVRLFRCTLIDLGFDFVEELILAGENDSEATLQMHLPECEADLYNVEGFNDIVFVIQGSFDTCGAEVVKNTTHITYIYHIRTARDEAFAGIVDLTSNIELEFSCSYPLEYDVQSSPGVEPLRRTVEIFADTEEGSFDVDISIFQDEDFLFEFESDFEGNPPTTTVPDEIFVNVQLNSDVERLGLKVKRCELSNSYPLNPVFQLLIINDQCPVAERAVLLETDNKRNRFSFTSFEWADPDVEQLIFVVCKIVLCDPASSGCEIEPNCDKKKKRSLLELNEEDKHSHDIFVGPIKIKHLESKSICSQNNGGCSHFCKGTNTLVAQCSCPPGYTLHKNKKLCIELLESNERVQNKPVNVPPGQKDYILVDRDIVLGSAALLAFLIAMTVFVLFTNKYFHLKQVIGRCYPLPRQTQPTFSTVQDAHYI